MLHLQQEVKLMENFEKIENYIKILRVLPLFQDVPETAIFPTLKCFNAKIKKYNAEDIILDVEDKISTVGIVLKGKIHVSKDDYFGVRNIIAELGVGELFGEVFASAGVEKSPVMVTAQKDCDILFIEYKKIVESCGATCSQHTSIIKNMLKILAKRNILLNEKIEILGKRSIRDKINFYLMREVERQRKNEVEIEFSRQELADFLCIDRCSMTRELSKMQKEELIEINKKKIKILENLE